MYGSKVMGKVRCKFLLGVKRWKPNDKKEYDVERQGFKAVILLSLTAEIININSHGFIENYLTPQKI